MKKILFLVFILLLIIPTNLFAVELTSPNAILIEQESGKILYEKDAYSEVYPASTTKILTAIMAIENCNLKDKVTASYNAVMSVPYDGTTAAIQVGETWTVDQLIDAMMVCSANEAANILAEHIGGSIESFASMMNSRAKELGAKSTNFVNPNGLHDNEHKTTAYDMAMIARHGMQNLPKFKEASALTKFSLPPTNIYDKTDRNFVNTNKMLISSSSYYYKHANGIKTGYTSRALNCIIAGAEKDGVKLIAVVFGAMGALNRTNDTKALFEYGFEQLKSKTIMPANNIVTEFEVKGAPSDANIIKAAITQNVVHTIPASASVSDYEPIININKDLKAPVNSGDVVGTIKFNIEGIDYEYNLIAVNGVEKFLNNVAAVVTTTTKTVGKIIGWAVGLVIGFFVVLVLLRAAIMTKRQKVRRRRMALYNSRFR